MKNYKVKFGNGRNLGQETNPMTQSEAIQLAGMMKGKYRCVTILKELDDGVIENKGKFFLHQIIS